MRTFYLAGPMRGFPHFNFPAFDRAAAAGRDKPFCVISPAEMDRANPVEPDADGGFGPAKLRIFAQRDLAVILSLKAEYGDGIALLPGWWKSLGAFAEYAVSRWTGLAVYDATTWEPYDTRKLFWRVVIGFGINLWRSWL